MCGEGRWYLGSAALHAVAILSLGLIAVAVPLQLSPQDAASFEAADADRPLGSEIPPFEVGDPPLDPSELNAKTLGQSKALPLAARRRATTITRPSSKTRAAGS